VSSQPPAETTDRGRFNRRIDDAFEEASRLAGSALPPTDFYDKFLNLTLNAISAPAGAVWLRTPQGFLQVACQANLEKVGLDEKRGGRQCHNEVLRQVFQAAPPRPVMLEPQGRLSGVNPEPGSVPAANLTDYYALFAPIIDKEQKSLGLLEVFHTPDQEPRLYQTYLQYTLQMAGYASQYHTFTGPRQSAGAERTFSQVEAFSRLIHGTLNPTECAYHVANEGRRLVECDRLCVGVRHGRYSTVEAVSGADVVEKASTHVRRMKKLFDAVLKFNDKLIFTGERDDALPPDVLHALDEYLAESQPKLLVVQPIRDEREKDEKKPARSVLLLETFNPPENTQPILARLDVVAKHAASALYNAAELKKIPMKWAWRPMVALQEGLGGKARAIVYGVIAGIFLLLICMTLIPYPLKLDAKGQYQPEKVVQVFPPYAGEVIYIQVTPGENVAGGYSAVKMHNGELLQKISNLIVEERTQTASIGILDQQLKQPGLPPGTEVELKKQKAEAQSKLDGAMAMQKVYRDLYNMPGNDGFFYAKVPMIGADYVIRPELMPQLPSRYDPTGKDLLSEELQKLMKFKVLSQDKNDELKHRTVRPNEPLLRLGFVNGNWRGELKIPQRNIGHIARAFAVEGHHKVEEVPSQTQLGAKEKKKYLDVDVLFSSSPDTSYPGRIYEADISGEAVPNRDDHNESEPVVIAYVKVNLDTATPAELRSLYVAGQEVRVKIKCGSRAMGYSLFHGVWEWFYEKVIFFF